MDFNSHLRQSFVRGVLHSAHERLRCRIVLQNQSRAVSVLDVVFLKLAESVVALLTVTFLTTFTTFSAFTMSTFAIFTPFGTLSVFASAVFVTVATF
jgi:fluoride ion exporter CrcB/FEX